MQESTFIFFVFIVCFLSIFLIAGFCVAIWMQIKEKLYHAKVQSKVLTLQSTLKKGK